MKRTRCWREESVFFCSSLYIRSETNVVFSLGHPLERYLWPAWCLLGASLEGKMSGWFHYYWSPCLLHSVVQRDRPLTVQSAFETRKNRLDSFLLDWEGRRRLLGSNCCNLVGRHTIVSFARLPVHAVRGLSYSSCNETPGPSWSIQTMLYLNAQKRTSRNMMICKGVSCSRIC